MANERTKKEMFNWVFAQVLKEGADLRVQIKTPDMPEPEIIINPNANVAAKIAYYNDAYDDDMCLKRNPQIRMESPDFYYIDRSR